ncbi:MAG: SufD family Fe-S cluster assembly protein, partial [Candidatus Marinimicrobia bacterium]|nr:SufD family Fe-S cluster assembly protein [Candidatus Neomarinimicrobiota bacterium]
ASHGATVGNLDKEEIFYLMSRGLTKSSAEKLIIYGFFRPVLKSIDSEILREHIYGFIDKKLGV